MAIDTVGVALPDCEPGVSHEAFPDPGLFDWSPSATLSRKARLETKHCRVWNATSPIIRLGTGRYRFLY